MQVNNYRQVRVRTKQIIRGEIKALRRGRAFCVAALLLIAALAMTFLAAQSPQWKEDVILVQPRPGVTEAALGQIVGRFGGRSERRLGGLNVHLVRLPAAANEAAVAAALQRHPQIQFAELDFLLPPGELPDDPRYPDAWHLPKVEAPGAWNDSLGQGVVVAVLDTGVDSSHSDLQGQLVSGWNVYDNNSDTSDVHGHGTKVAGVVAAASNNGLGVASVAWHASVMPMRISRPDGWAYFSTIAEGILWAADHGARVANASYAASGSSSVRSAADYMRSLGGLVVISAGNGGSYDSTAPSDSVLSVSATNSSDLLASWSSYGQYVDLAAPGVGIWTTTRGGGYSAPSGTSFSSPLVAGIVALMMAANPSLDAQQLETLLLENSDDLGDPGYDVYFGHGRANARRAVQAAAGTSGGSDTTPPVATITEPTGGTVAGSLFVRVSASDNVGVTRADFFVDGSFVASDYGTPWEFDWDTRDWADGPAALQVFAYDAAGNEGDSQSVSVNIENVPDLPDVLPPNVQIATPSEGAKINGTVQVMVQANDDRAIYQIRLFIDGKAVSSQNSDTLTYAWNTRKASLGWHTLVAEAEDTSGNQSSASIQVEVVERRRGGRKGRN